MTLSSFGGAHRCIINMGNKSTGRDYSYDKKYEKSPEQLKRNAARKRARYAMEKAGKVHEGDGKDVNHRAANKHGPLSNKMSNLNVESKKKNRGRKV